MKKIAIVTDSNSGITQEMGKTMGIHVIPMPFFIDGELFLEDITLTQEEFYKRLGEDSDISTSQPSPGEVMECWDELLKEYDEIVHIPMSSGLSSTCHAAQSLSQEYEGKVCVVDNQRISVTQKQSVEDAIVLRDAGKSASEIKEILEAEKLQASIYITVDTLKYLKKGGLILGYSQFLYYTKKHPDCQAFRAPLLLFIFFISHGFNFYANLDKSASRAS